MKFSSRKRISTYINTVLNVCAIIAQVRGQTTTLSPLEVEQIIQELFGMSNECNCTPINMCNKYKNSTINTTGEGLIDIRLGQCQNSLDICCDEVKINPAPQNPNPIFRPSRTRTCGYRNENGVGFKITAGNQEAQFGEFPWMIAILGKRVDGDVVFFEYRCGGSLIHERVVLTGAHCVQLYVNRTDELLLRAGEWDSISDSETIPYQQRSAEKVVYHKMFQSGGLENDIALVFLEKPFDFDDNVDVVCLPTKDENLDGARCVACGWGKENFDASVYQNILKKVDLPIVQRTECHQRLMATRLGPRFKLHESFICAGGVVGIDTCKGDGGSPLMCPIPGNSGYYQQVGIVAWGIGCGNAIPGVYVNIPYFRSWIDDQFNQNNIDSSSYINVKKPKSLGSIYN